MNEAADEDEKIIFARKLAIKGFSFGISLLLFCFEFYV